MMENKNHFSDLVLPLGQGKRIKDEIYECYNRDHVYLADVNSPNITQLTNCNVNKKISFKKNKFIINSLTAIGGGALKHLSQCMRYMRFGGSTFDKLLYMANYVDNSNKDYEYKLDFSFLKDSLSIPNNIHILTSTNVFKYANINFAAMPGATIRMFDFKDKEEAIKFYTPLYQALYVSWCSEPNSKFMPNELWSAGSRPKLFNVFDKVRKTRNNPTTCARVISVASAYEQLIGVCVWQPIMHAIEEAFKRTYTGICIGVNRMSDDWQRIATHFNGCHYVFTGDYSRFDSTVPRHLVIRSLDFCLSLLSKDNVYQNNYISNFRTWFINNVVDKTYVIDGKFRCDVFNGMPSGSLWTSLLNSVYNMMVLQEAVNDYGILDKCKILVYGDDHIIFIYTKIKMLKFKRHIHEFTKNNFGMTNNYDKMNVARPSQFYVNYKRPIYKVSPEIDLTKGTSNLKPIRYEYSDKPFPSYDHNNGTTHRWSYNFKRRPVFLSFYFLIDGNPIRPWNESLVRIVHPEKPIRNVDEHKILLRAHLNDNFHNAHTRNWMYHLLYDCCFLSKGYDKIKGKFSSEYDIVNNKMSRHIYWASKPIYGSRFWYRHINEYVSLMEEPCMLEFNRYYSNLLNNIKKSFDVCGQFIPFYKVKDFQMALLKKGFTNRKELEIYLARTGYYKTVIDAMSLLQTYSHNDDFMVDVLNKVEKKTKNISLDIFEVLYGTFFLSKNDIVKMYLVMNGKKGSNNDLVMYLRCALQKLDFISILKSEVFGLFSMVQYIHRLFLLTEKLFLIVVILSILNKISNFVIRIFPLLLILFRLLVTAFIIMLIIKMN